MTHPDFCLQTKDPEKATLFYVPYLLSVEFKNEKGQLGDFKTSPFGEALTDATGGNYQLWEERFGLASKFWERRNGSASWDDILRLTCLPDVENAVSNRWTRVLFLSTVAVVKCAIFKSCYGIYGLTT
jgi:hypothetical protein